MSESGNVRGSVQKGGICVLCSEGLVCKGESSCKVLRSHEIKQWMIKDELSRRIVSGERPWRLKTANKKWGALDKHEH